jgi:rubrerythrin
VADGVADGGWVGIESSGLAAAIEADAVKGRSVAAAGDEGKGKEMSKKAYVSPEGRHRHKCNKCKIVWEHDESCWGSDTVHMCPGCGELKFLRYKGPLVPTEARTDSVSGT